MYNNAFIRNISKLASGNAIGAFIAFIAYPLLTRIYSQESFGIFGIAASFFSISAVISTLSYELAIITASDEEQVENITDGTLLIIIICTFISAFVLSVLIKFKISGFGALSYIYIVPTCLCGAFISANALFRYQLLRNEDFKGLSLIPIAQNTVRSIVQISSYSINRAGLGLLLGEFLSRGLTLLYSYNRIEYKLNIKKIINKVGKIFKTLTINKRFPIFILPSILINTIAISIQVPVIASYFGLKTAGAFVLARMVFSAPIKVLGSSIADVFHKKIVDKNGNPIKNLTSIYIKTSGYLMIIGLPACIIMIFYSGPIIESVFGSKWVEAGKIAGLLAPWALAQFVVTSVSRVVFVIDMKGLKMYFDTIIMTCVLIIPYLFYNTSMNTIEIMGYYLGSISLCYIPYYLLMLSRLNNINED